MKLHQLHFRSNRVRWPWTKNSNTTCLFAAFYLFYSNFFIQKKNNYYRIEALDYNW